MITIIILLALLRGDLTQNCSIGCLRCDQNQLCTLCDSTQKYYLSQTSCSLSTKQYCILIDSFNNCLQCAPNYYIDQNTQNCIQPTSSPPNCQILSNSGACAFCAPNFYLLGNKCSAATILILNCQLMQTDGFCSQCSPTFVLSYDQKSCNPSVNVSNCAFYGPVKCQSCQTSYVLNQNNIYTQLFQNATNINSNIQKIMLSFLNNYSFYQNITVCNLVQVVCKEYITVSTCKSCIDGYFMNSNSTCVQYPLDTIPNCNIFALPTICSACADGYYLLSQNQCVSNTPIPNCVLYANNSTTSSCIKCTNDSFVSSATACAKRVSSVNISNCNTVLLNQDGCAVCASGTSPTNDFQKCLPNVPNCQSYVYSTSFNSALTCQNCNPGFYIGSNSICVQGGIQNCSVYSSSTQCLTCEPKYYVSSGTCVSQTPINNCLTYSSTVPNICNTCIQNYYPFTLLTTCSAITAIPQCALYTTQTTCQTCNNGYSLNSGGTCDQITITNCSSINAGNCVKCKIGLVLNSNKCYSPLTAMLLYCNSNNFSGTVDYPNYSCNRCASGSFPINYINHYICYDSVLIGQWGSTVAANCAKVDSNYNCIGCSSGYFLQVTSSVGSCVQNCPSANSATIIKYNINSTVYTPAANYICETITPTNCKFSTAANNQKTTEGGISLCIVCDSNYYPVVAFSPSVTASIPFFSYDQINMPQPTAFPIAFNPTVSCQGTVFLIVTNCSYYASDSPTTSNFYCVRCNIGYQGFFTTANPTYISTCNLIPNCTQVFNLGLSRNLNALNSCHVCQDSYRIPFLFVRAGATFSTTNGILGVGNYAFNKTPLNTSTITAPGGATVQCFSITEMTTNIPNLNLPPFCAIGIVNIQAATLDCSHAQTISNTDPAKIAVFCGACSQGYSRTNTPIPEMTAACTPIPNCAGSVWFDYCSNCAPGYVYGYSDANGVDYTTCLNFTADRNCYAAYTSSCALCKIGYSFNLDMICDLQVSPNCYLFIYAANEKPASTLLLNISTLMFLKPNEVGCQSCQVGFIARQIASAVYFCTKSNYISGTLVSSTKYIQNCQNFFFTTSLLCAACKSNFILSSSQTNCYQIINLPFCLTAQNSSTCNVCQQGYTAVNGICQNQNISNCISYSNGQTGQICNSCVNEYFLNNNTCIKGNVNNCLIYGTSGSNCIQCNIGFVLINTKNLGTYCFKIDPTLNCSVFNSNSFNQNQISCQTCVTGYVPVTLTTSTMTCIQFNSLSGCLIYDIGSSIINSSFLCLNCDKSYYNNNGICVQRSNPDINCQIQNANFNYCSVCNSGFYLNASNFICVPNPIGIVNCRIYQNMTTCLGCKTNFYLSNNLCVSVPSANQILNCLYYSDSKTCSFCVPNYILSGVACVILTAQNCQTSSSPSTCSSCIQGQMLSLQNGITSCVSITDTNCLTYSQNPFNCTLCASTYFKLNNTCTQVAPQIIGCTYYSDGVTCSQCSPNFVLSTDGKTCSQNIASIVDGNCLDNRISSSNCLICKPGYYFVGGVCTACQAQNCMYCNASNSTECLMCQSGAFMNSNFTCILPVNNTPNNTNETTKSSNGNYRIMLIAIIYILQSQINQILNKYIFKVIHQFVFNKN